MDGILLSKKIGIIGGGISGLVVGIFLAKEGHQVSIFEKNRIKKIKTFDSEVLEVSTSKRSEPRVPFGQIIERGMLSPGEQLWSLNGRHKAKVRADGT